jgi:hypothetical protein
MAKAKTKNIARASKKRGATKSVSDASLIRECVAYAQSIAAFNAGFKADPDGSMKYASKAGDYYSRRAEDALNKMSQMKARTPEGLQAKARIISDIIGSVQYEGFDGSSAAFLRIFGVEVKNFLQSIVEEGWRERKKAA